MFEIEGNIVGFINSGCAFEVVMSDNNLKKLIGHDPIAPNVVIISVLVDPPSRARDTRNFLCKSLWLG